MASVGMYWLDGTKPSFRSKSTRTSEKLDRAALLEFLQPLLGGRRVVDIPARNIIRIDLVVYLPKPGQPLQLTLQCITWRGQEHSPWRD